MFASIQDIVNQLLIITITFAANEFFEFGVGVLIHLLGQMIRSQMSGRCTKTRVYVMIYIVVEERQVDKSRWICISSEVVNGEMISWI